jgi:hypothetical protein
MKFPFAARHLCGMPNTPIQVKLKSSPNDTDKPKHVCGHSGILCTIVGAQLFRYPQHTGLVKVKPRSKQGKCHLMPVLYIITVEISLQHWVLLKRQTARFTW